MANLNQNGGTGIKTPSGVICDFYKNSKATEREVSKFVEAAQTNLSAYEEVRKYKICCLLKAEETHDFYQAIDNTELTLAMKAAEAIQANVDVQIKKNDELEKLLKEIAKLFGDLRTKLHDAYDESCKMSNCFPPNFFEDGKHPELKKALDQVTGRAKSLDAAAYQACDDSITTAGIHTFFLVDSLKGFSQSVVTKMKELKTGVTDNAKKATDDIKTAQTDLIKVLELLNTKEVELYNNQASGLAHASINQFICTEPTCPPKDSIDTICENLATTETSTGKGRGSGRKYVNED